MSVKLEGLSYLQIKLQTMADYEQAVAILLGKKARHVVLTLGAQGVLAGS